MAYDLQPVRSPLLKGMKLRLVTRLLESPWSRRWLMPSLLKSTGVAAFREQSPNADPVTVPLVRPRVSADPEKTEAEGFRSLNELVDLAEGDSGGTSKGFRPRTILDYARAYRNREACPEQVGQGLVEMIEASNRGDRPLRGFIEFDPDDLATQASESAKRLASGNPRSVLEGVPVSIKDELDQPPYHTRVGTRFLGDETAACDAAVVARLRNAGALLVGKTNMFEIGISPTGTNPNHGFARNPYHLDHDAGGSSGGAANTVASGLVPLAIGADGGGSIRVPASHCGVFGLKPTFGRVSERGAAPLCWSLAHIGPLGATAMDVALGCAAISGPDPGDPQSLVQPSLSWDPLKETDLRGITIGIYPEWFDSATASIVAPCRAMLSGFEEAGATLREISVAGLEAMRVGHAVTILSEMAAAMEPYDGAHRKDFIHATRMNLALAREFTNLDYLKAQRVRGEAMKEWERVFSEVDVVVTPTTACPSPVIDPETLSLGVSDLATLTELMRFVSPGNFCGLPAMSFPVGYDAEGIPIGMQAMGRHWNEAVLLRVARVAESGVERRQPGLSFDPLG